MSKYLYIVATVLFTVYGQLVIKWQVNKAGALPDSLMAKIQFFISLLINPWILSAFVAAFLAALSWLGAMSKFELSYAYPFMSLAFVLVMFMSSYLLDEPVTAGKLVGTGLIMLGIIVLSRG